MPVRVLFQDEGRFGRISDHRRCWAPLPARPTVGRQVVREYVHAFVALCPWRGQVASLILPAADTDCMSLFLAHTAAQFPGQFCVMVLDGAGWHGAKALRVPEHMRLLFLPPYSPELNPVEHVWEHLRENYFRNQVLPSIDRVEDVLMDGLRQLIAQPETVRSLALFSWLIPLCMT